MRKVEQWHNQYVQGFMSSKERKKNRDQKSLKRALNKESVEKAVEAFTLTA